MLVLNRRIGHSVCIGNNVEVMVTGISLDENGDMVVSLGFEAPKYINIDRKEIRKKRIEKIDEVMGKYNENTHAGCK